MRVARVSSVLLSGLIVYYAMAACSGGGSSNDASSTGLPPRGTSSSGASGGADGSSGSSGVVPNAMADQWYASGSRVKLRYLDGDDGAKQFLGWYDSMRSENCGFATHADTSWRCMPTDNVAGIVGYFEAGCTQPVATVTTKGAPMPKYGRFYDTAGARFYPVTGSAGTTIYAGTPASCTATSVPEFDFYTVGAEIPSTAFAGATPKVAP